MRRMIGVTAARPCSFCWSACLGNSRVLVIGAAKTYPRRATVRITFCASSLSAFRMSVMHFVSDSSVTTTSGQIAWRSSSRVTTRPARSGEIPQHLKRLWAELELGRSTRQAFGGHVERHVEKGIRRSGLAEIPEGHVSSFLAGARCSATSEV